MKDGDENFKNKIKTEFEKQLFFKSLSDCDELLNKYIVVLNDMVPPKVGGIKMKALKSQNTPKKTQIPKKSYHRS